MSPRRRRPLARIADPADVEMFVEGLPDKFLLCRRFGHAFLPHTARLATTRRDGWDGYDTTKRCTRCHHIVGEIFDLEMNFIKTLPRYPKGYLASGMGRIAGEGRNVVRKEMLMRTMSKQATTKERRLKAV